MSAGRGFAGRAGCPGWVRLLLVVSLAANLAVAGVVIGHNFRADHRPDRRGADRVTEWIIDLVPAERQEFARRHLSDLPNRLESERADRMTHLPEIVAAIEREPFDPEALDAALSSMSDRRESDRMALRQSLISLLAALTPEERASFAENFRERLDSRERRGGA